MNRSVVAPMGGLLFVLMVSGVSSGQQAAPMSVSVDFEGSSDSGKKTIAKYVADGLESRGVHKISDNGLDPSGHLFDDHGWIVIKPASSSGALEIQLSIVQGASVNNMLFRFRGSLTAMSDQQLKSTLDKLMDEVKREFGSPAYRLGWHPIPVPHPAG